MASNNSAFMVVPIFICSLILLLSSSQSQAQLSPTFYDKTCPNALNIIRTAVRQAVSRERRMAASLVRLHFHDCFVQGCDASILLDQSPTIESEKTALPNLGSARGYDVVEAAKRELEKACPGIVSCADVLSVAARDASAAVGGPTWTVKMGRRDSTTASRTIAETDLPSPFANLDSLISSFASKGLNTRDMVALSGAHTLGQAQCFLFRDRIYGNGTDIDAGFASTRRRTCPKDTGNGNLAALDLVTPNSFDNNYYKNLLQKKGLLQSDQVLFSGGATDSIVSEYAKSPRALQADFASAMIKMSEIQPLTGQNGIIRKVCGVLSQLTSSHTLTASVLSPSYTEEIPKYSSTLPKLTSLQIHYKNLLQRKCLLQSDQVLFSGGATDSIVSEYAKSPRTFQADFASAMVKMSEIQPLTGQNRNIRKVYGTLK